MRHWFDLFRSRAGRATACRHRKPTPRQRSLALEILEDRSVPAALSLGQAGHFAVLSLPKTSDFVAGSSGVTGEFGVGPRGALYLMGDSSVAGPVALNRDANPRDDAHLWESSKARVGSVADQDLNGAVADALQASATCAGLKPTQTFGNIRSSTTIVGNGGTNVISARSIDLGGRATLTLTGGPDDVFVLDVAGTLALRDNGAVRLRGGLVASHVLFNALGGGGEDRTVRLSGHGSFAGTILAPHRSFSMGPATLDGAVIAGGEALEFHCGARVHGDPFSPPASQPASLSGYVYADNNNDGVMDAGDTGLAGVVMVLTGTTAQGQSVSLTATTDANGLYSFTGLRAGTYQVNKQANAPGYMDGQSNVGTVNGASDGAVQQDLSIGQVVLNAGNKGLNYNFGEVPVIS